MRANGERGAAQLSSILSLIAVIALALAGWNVGPLYFDHYDFQDKVNEICRTPKYKARTDEIVIDMVMKEVRERRLGEYIGRGNIQVSTTDTSRQINIYSASAGKLLPGWERTFAREIKADQPLI
jgi:hypothetical protein